MESGKPLPPVYPDMWMIKYPTGNVYFADDADKLFNRDFDLVNLVKIGSWRIIDKANDSIMLNLSSVKPDGVKGWEYKLRADPYLGRMVSRVDNFLYREGEEFLPFSIKMIQDPTMVYAFRPDSNSNECFFIFFSYTFHKNFPKSLLAQFSEDPDFGQRVGDPFEFEFPPAQKQPELIYQAEPEYPPHLKNMRRSGKTTLKVLVDIDGTVAWADIVKRARYTPFDVAARDAAYKSFYEPALDSDGKPIQSWATMEIVFDPNK
jgi:TonB family protein